ncbi:Scr1 family TA system antitoxin-like transcriptional regulator [Streptomyces sp. NPDC058279]|uniref:Scr1 family TA system antitoxin-like transcriptional regulator n=1 Tax=Streptomyces sp. NPDC058279 TaxID=3346418 RepID=UPI0036EE635C
MDHTRRFRVYCNHVIPGLLQTQDYATAVIAAYGTFHALADTDATSAARARLERSKVLARPGRTFAFVLEERTLRPGVADAAATAGQLERLLTVMALPQVSLGIVPAGPPAYCGPPSPSPSTTAPRSGSSCCPRG